VARIKWNGNQALAYYRPQAQRAVNRALLVGEGVSKAHMPVLSGTARRSVHIEEGTSTSERVTGQLGSSIIYVKWIEIGSRGRPGKFPLAKGLDAAVPALKQELKALQ